MKKVVIFGGSGFLGSYVADELSCRGFKVIIADLVESKYLKKEQEFRKVDILNIKEILRNRVVLREISDPIKQKPCPKLSEIPLFDAFVSTLKRDVIFNPSSFNPLKYDFRYHRPGFQLIRVDNTNYFIMIKPQHYNN